MDPIQPITRRQKRVWEDIKRNCEKGESGGGELRGESLGQVCPELEQGSPRGAPGKRPQPSSASPLPALSLGFFLCPSVCRCFSLALSPCCLCCSPSRTLSLSLSKKAESLGESSGRRGEFFVRDYFSKLAQVLTHIPLHINAVPGRNRASLLPTISREAGFTKKGGASSRSALGPPWLCLWGLRSGGLAMPSFLSCCGARVLSLGGKKGSVASVGICHPQQQAPGALAVT